ncbi:MAG: 1,4-alpha-glucan branching protein [Chitinophagaceae bacterium]|nr:1,4-alpha-glucan branching protein [Chitinophagaceae bacterium]
MQRVQVIEQPERVDWRLNTNLYEVNLRQYTQAGSFKAFTAALPRLKEMGVKTLWFMPITPIAGERMKGTMGSYYACSDYTAINPEFGTLNDFKALVKAAHKQEFKVIIDWVANHTGWDHVWTRSNPEFYKKDAAGVFKAASGMDDIIELDYDNPQLVQAMIGAMRFWVNECDIDGFRCDLASWVPLHFWKKARPGLDAIKPLFWLGEMDAIESKEYLEVFDAAYAWQWMHTTETFYKKDRRVELLVDLLNQYSDVCVEGKTALFFTSNHDENSWNGTEFEKYGDMANALAVLGCTWKGMPLLYSGQELPNVKRLKFFDKDVIEWNGSYSMQGFYQKLLQLHSSNPALCIDAPVKILPVQSDRHILSYYRSSGKEWVLVMLNLSPYPARFRIRSLDMNEPCEELFSGEAKQCSADSWFELPQWGYKVYVKK